MTQRLIGIGRRVLALNGPEIIVEPFTGPNGPLATNSVTLKWTRHVFDQGFEWEINGNQGVFAVTNAPGNPTNSYEDLQTPSAIPGSDDVRMSFTVTARTLPAGGDYWVGVGFMGRLSFFRDELGEEDYRAIGCEFAISNLFLPPGVTAHVILWHVDGHAADPQILDIHLVSSADITLPGVLQMEWVGDTASVSFDHAGVGPTLEAEATIPPTYETGTYAIGGGHVLDPTFSTSFTVDTLLMENVGAVNPKIISLNV